MKYLIVVTGLPGTGKTSIAKHLKLHLDNSTILSVDQLKENIYDLIGFHSRNEKTSIRKLSYDIFSMLLTECMKRGDKIIITEYPFDDTWNNTIKDISKAHNYMVITIQVTCNDMALNYSRMVQRDRTSDRHVAQCLKEYNPIQKSQYQSIEKWNYDYFKEFHDSFTYFNLGKIIKVENGNNSMDQILEYVLSSIHSIIG